MDAELPQGVHDAIRYAAREAYAAGRASRQGELDALREDYKTALEAAAREKERAIRAEGELNALREALIEVHEYHCGCDDPGSWAKCIMEPREAVVVLSLHKEKESSARDYMDTPSSPEQQ